MDILIVFFFFFSWVLTYYSSTSHSSDLVNQSGFVDLVDKAKWYQQSYTLDSIVLLFILVKIVWVFRISRFLHWALLTVDKVSSIPTPVTQA